MANSAEKSAKKTDDTKGAVGSTAATPLDPQTTSPTIDTEAGVTMGDGIHHLHSLAKGDEDFINGTDQRTDREQTTTDASKKNQK